MVVTAKHLPDQVVMVDIWTSGDYVWDTSKPLPVFARVLLNTAPVCCATVLLHTEIVTSTGTVLSSLPLEMRDDGATEPDMEEQDGIYSLLITSFPTQGQYRLSVSVETDDRSAWCHNNHNNHNNQARVRIFRRTVQGPSVLIQSLPSQDSFPPGRITDFRVEVESEMFLARWTSSGGDYQAGVVAGYTVLCSPSMKDMLGTAEKEVVMSVRNSQVGGMANSVYLTIPHYDQYLYLGIVGEDSAGNLGTMSNIVTIYQPSTPHQGRHVARVMIMYEGELLGSVCGILLVILVMSLYCYKTHTPSVLNTGYFSDDTPSQYDTEYDTPSQDDTEHAGSKKIAVRNVLQVSMFTQVKDSVSAMPEPPQYDSSHAYMTMCDYTAPPPPYSLDDTKQYFTNIHKFVFPKHGTIV